MRIDPGNKWFITFFCVVIVGVVGFFFASIFIDFAGDVEIKKIEFGKSKFWINVKQLKSDKRCVLEVYNGDKWLQNVVLGTDFEGRKVETIAIDKGWIIRSTTDDEISFIIDVDDANFSSLYVRRQFHNKESIVTDCLNLEPDDLNWYGGPEQKNQKYPIQKFEFTDYAYITKEESSAAIMERYWLSSRGFFILFDYDAPLFIDQNTDKICFTGKKALPYYIHNDVFSFNYRIGASINARETHVNVINKMLGKPLGIPDERLVRYPIWNTWVQYNHWAGNPINQTLVVEFANEIVKHGFKYSLLDIDDRWELCYGSMTIDKTVFPDMKALTTDLKSRGFSVALWVHPFINKNCEPHFSYARDNNLLVKSYAGSTDTSWWNSAKNAAGHVDFTNPKARSWFRQRLEAIQHDEGVDIFKFDGGETTWYPEDPVLTGDELLTPSQLTRSFVEMASDFGDLLEIRTGWGTQHLKVLVRMLDFDSRWSEENGLKSLIPTLLQFNLNGYVFCLPDMIGGNQYGEDKITKQLFIRWLQASVFMPSIQFSWAPWSIDEETIQISKRFTELHEAYADLILERFRFAVSDGHPVNPPIWWLDPEDEAAQQIDDGKVPATSGQAVNKFLYSPTEFLLGETILVAPVVEEDKFERDIYLPVGTWEDGNDGTIYYGPIWIRKYPVPLEILPYFIRTSQFV